MNIVEAAGCNDTAEVSNGNECFEHISEEVAVVVVCQDEVMSTPDDFLDIGEPYMFLHM